MVKIFLGALIKALDESLKQFLSIWPAAKVKLKSKFGLSEKKNPHKVKFGQSCHRIFPASTPKKFPLQNGGVSGGDTAISSCEMKPSLE